MATSTRAVPLRTTPSRNGPTTAKLASSKSSTDASKVSGEPSREGCVPAAKRAGGVRLT